MELNEKEINFIIYVLNNYLYKNKHKNFYEIKKKTLILIKKLKYKSLFLVLGKLFYDLEIGNYKNNNEKKLIKEKIDKIMSKINLKIN